MKILIYIMISLALLLFPMQCRNQIYSEASVLKMSSTSQDENEKQDPMNLPVVSNLTGRYLKAFVVAYEAFRIDRDVSPDKRKIENYEIQLRETQEYYFVFLLAKRSPAERNMKGGSSSLGQDVMYRIRRRDYRIMERTFFK